MSIGGNVSRVLPEQLILLHIIKFEIDGNTDHSHDMDLFGNPDFAGNLNGSYIFLCNLYANICQGREIYINSGNGHETGNKVDNEDNNCDIALQQSACETILEIIVSTLGSETALSELMRMRIGTETKFLQNVLIDLSLILDSINQLNENIVNRTRDFVFPQSLQRYCTLAVRVIGTLCYRCSTNQDLLRLTPVVPTNRTRDTHAGIEQTEFTEERNGLHVLLSTTSISHSCFTLREWSVLAIRYALEDNTANKNLVQQLETQHAVQSTVLKDLGLKVEFDTRNGKASIQPTDTL
jgi:Spinocerebellar ataxia type 10 protein domain